MPKKKQYKIAWYQPCERCGYETGKAVKPENDIKRCWKCGVQVYRDYKKERIEKEETTEVWGIAKFFADKINPGMNDCERFGMTWGCAIDCPVLQAGKCELKDDENKELYEEFLSQNESK